MKHVVIDIDGLTLAQASHRVAYVGQLLGTGETSSDDLDEFEWGIIEE